MHVRPRWAKEWLWISIHAITVTNVYAQTIDLTSYERQRDKLREELTLGQIDHHAESIEELDVQGILAFAERILPRASDLWVQASLDCKQRLQRLFFPEGIAFDGNRFNRTAATAPLFKYLAPSESADEKMVTQIPNRNRTGPDHLIQVRLLADRRDSRRVSRTQSALSVSTGSTGAARPAFATASIKVNTGGQSGRSAMRPQPGGGSPRQTPRCAS
jgi:hypothetical protein